MTKEKLIDSYPSHADYKFKITLKYFLISILGIAIMFLFMGLPVVLSPVIVFIFFCMCIGAAKYKSKQYESIRKKELHIWSRMFYRHYLISIPWIKVQATKCDLMDGHITLTDDFGNKWNLYPSDWHTPFTKEDILQIEGKMFSTRLVQGLDNQGVPTGYYGIAPYVEEPQ